MTSATGELPQPTLPSTLTMVERLAFHIEEMERWASGGHSYTNTIRDNDICAVMDAQEVVKHGAAVQAYAVVLGVTFGTATGGPT